MKGAIAELCARTISAATKKRVTNIGTSHHLLLPQKNHHNSPTLRGATVKTVAMLRHSTKQTIPIPPQIQIDRGLPWEFMNIVERARGRVSPISFG
jgi:hypothetical protein